MAEGVESGHEGEVTDESIDSKKKEALFFYERNFCNYRKRLKSPCIIQSKLTNNITNRKKNEVWQEITDAVNAVGMAGRTVAEMKEEWKN